MNLPAIFITADHHRRSGDRDQGDAGFNATMVFLNIAVILAVVGIGVSYIDPKNWHPFLHEEKGWHGVAEGAGRIFFAYIGFDSISTHAEEARRPSATWRSESWALWRSAPCCTWLSQSC